MPFFYCLNDLSPAGRKPGDWRKLQPASKLIVLERCCEAVAAERAGWTERTAGQQPADALINSARAKEAEHVSRE
jgi:hypothetical protein